MNDHGFTTSELERVLTFEGYGNKAAPYWLIGMEEGGGSMEELRERARLFEPIEDLHSVAKIGLEKDMLNRPTLRVISKLIMAMQGTPGWHETLLAKEYHATKLGRTEGESFLAEVMPFPCQKIGGDWQYPLIYPTKEDYIAKVRPGRISWLRSEISVLKPRFVICYGKENWPVHREIFNDVDFKPELNGQILVGQRGPSTFLLLHFLSYYFQTQLMSQIANHFARAPKDEFQCGI